MFLRLCTNTRKYRELFTRNDWKYYPQVFLNLLEALCSLVTNDRLRAFVLFKNSIKNESYSVPLSCGKRGK